MEEKHIISIIQEKVLSTLDMRSLDVHVDVPDEQFGDYSTNVALILSKQGGGNNPMQVASQIVEKLNADSDVSQVFQKIEALPPGFINFYLHPKKLIENLNEINQRPDSYGSSKSGNGKLALVEYFQLNVAKPPHVGHIGSAVIGDSIKRILISQGYKTVSDTHIGDWGTQFGIMLWAYKNLDGRSKVKDNPLEELNELYVEANNLIAQKSEIREEGKKEFVLLESGDSENKKLWEFFVSVSKKEFDKYTKELGLLPFDYNLGESFYEEQMKEIVQKLKSASLLITGETGEQYVDLDEYGLGRLICIKSDGGTTYELRDLATLAYRYDVLAKNLKTEIFYNLYIVDARQSHDFKQVFKTMEMLGYDITKSKHVEFGFLTLPEGAMSSRKGNAIRLDVLLEEAVKRALNIINEKNEGLKNKEIVAKQIGLGALKYFNLSSNRKSDIVFDWAKSLSFEGDTGPYLQYSHARLKSILRKGNVSASKINTDISVSDIELDLLRYIIHFPEKIQMALDSFTPNTIANYLYVLSGKVNHFYQVARVLQEEDENLKKLRLAIVEASATVIRNGLYLLGIDAPEEM